MVVKLLIINGNQFGYDVGYHYYVKYLSKQHKIDYICFDKNLEKIYFPGNEIKYIEYANKYIDKIKVIFKLGKCIRKGDYDLVLFRNNKYAFLIKLLGGKRAVFDVRTVSVSPNFLKRRLYNLIVKFNTYFFERIFSISSYIIYYLRISNKDITIVPLGSNKYFNREEEFIQSLNFLYVGTFNNRNISDTIKGFMIFCREFPKVKVSYTIIGAGNVNEIRKLKSFINKKPDNLNICFEGYIPNNKLEWYFKKHYIGISYVPITEYFLPQPVTKTYEYLLAGMAVVATDLPSNTDVITDNNGVIIQDNPTSFADGVARIFKNLNLYNPKLIQKDSRIFEWKYIVDNHLWPGLEKEIRKYR
mgnify:CR=1 FL=1|jgi:hypothetical protein